MQPNMLRKQAEYIANSINSSMSTTQVNLDDYPNSLKLGIRVRIEQLTAVDTVSQSYRARMIQVTDWLATKDDIKDFEANKENFSPSRVVKPIWLNCISEDIAYVVCSQFLNNADGKLYNLRMSYLNVKFTEEFECGNFPFDVQDLSFIIDTDLGIDKVIFVPSRYKPDIFYVNTSFLALCDWEIVHSVCVLYIY